MNSKSSPDPPHLFYPIYPVKIYRMDRMGKKDGEDSTEV
jgi:hypothetical protein